MALVFKNEYMVIKWHLSSSLLNVTWLRAVECMSLLDYHQCLLTLGNYVDNFQPNIFVFDAYDFNGLAVCFCCRFRSSVLSSYTKVY